MVLRSKTVCPQGSKNVCAETLCSHSVKAYEAAIGPGTANVQGDLNVLQYHVEGQDTPEGGDCLIEGDLTVNGKINGGGGGPQGCVTANEFKAVKDADATKGTLTTEGEVTIGETLTVTVNTTLSGQTGLAGDVTIGGNLLLGGLVTPTPDPEADPDDPPAVPNLTGFILDDSYSEDATVMANFVTTQGAPDNTNVFGANTVIMRAVSANSFSFAAKPGPGAVNVIGTHTIRFAFTFNVNNIPAGRVPHVTHISIANDWATDVSQADTGVPIGMFAYAAGRFQALRDADFLTNGQMNFYYQLVRNMSWNQDTNLAFTVHFVWIKA